jgi:hypothetical protein
MKNLFFVPQPRMYLGMRGIFFFLKIYMSKNNKGECHRPHIMAGRRFPSVLLPRLCLLPHLAPALFICSFVCWLLRCHPKRRRHAVQSSTATAPGQLFDYCEIIHLYKVIRLYDFISTHFSHSGK